MLASQQVCPGSSAQPSTLGIASAASSPLLLDRVARLQSSLTEPAQAHQLMLDRIRATENMVQGLVPEVPSR